MKVNVCEGCVHARSLIKGMIAFYSQLNIEGKNSKFPRQATWIMLVDYEGIKLLTLNNWQKRIEFSCALTYNTSL